MRKRKVLQMRYEWGEDALDNRIISSKSAQTFVRAPNILLNPFA